MPNQFIRSDLERSTLQGDSPVEEDWKVYGGYPEYDRANNLSEGATHSVAILNTS